MSSTFQQHFTSDNLNMIRRVLDYAGLHDRLGEATHQARPSASRFLITCFQGGISTELALREELYHHLYQDMSEPVRAGENADIHGWENEGGAASVEPRITLQLVASQATDVRGVRSGFPAFIANRVSVGLQDDIPPTLPMAA